MEEEIGKRLVELVGFKEIEWDDKEQELHFKGESINSALLAVKLGQFLQDGRAKLIMSDDDMKFIKTICGESGKIV